jgi:hypothetical protein
MYVGAQRADMILNTKNNKNKVVWIISFLHSN